MIIFLCINYNQKTNKKRKRKLKFQCGFYDNQSPFCCLREWSSNLDLTGNLGTLTFLKTPTHGANHGCWHKVPVCYGSWGEGMIENSWQPWRHEVRSRVEGGGGGGHCGNTRMKKGFGRGGVSREWCTRSLRHHRSTLCVYWHYTSLYNLLIIFISTN